MEARSTVLSKHLGISQALVSHRMTCKSYAGRRRLRFSFSPAYFGFRLLGYAVNLGDRVALKSVSSGHSGR